MKRSAHNPTRRGTVMLETLMVLPLITLILALLYLLGRGTLRMHHTQTAARFEAQRLVAEQPALPLADAFYGSGQADVAWTSWGEIEWRDQDRGAGWALLDATPTVDTQDLARAMLDRFGQAHGYKLSVKFPGRFEELTGAYRARGYWPGPDWRYRQGGWMWRDAPIIIDVTPDGYFVTAPEDIWWLEGSRAEMLEPVADIFLTDMDQLLESLANQGHELAALMRGLYTGDAGYKSPWFTERYR